MPLTTAPSRPATIAVDLHHAPEAPPHTPVTADYPLIITIDGPAGTGKSTVARRLAERLGLEFLDTGAMYRAAAAIAIDRGHEAAVRAGHTADWLQLVLEADLHFDWRTRPPAVLAWLRPMDDRIRDHDVTALVSVVAAVAPLRKHMVQKQRIIGHQHPRLVTEGRDQGSVVFPDAPVKFYLDARPEVRAQRRADQLRAHGRDVDLNALLADIVRRDHLDSTRPDGPLTCPADAVRVDTSTLMLDEVVTTLEHTTRQRVADLINRDV